MIAFNKKNTDSEVRYQDLCISFYRKFSQIHLLDDNIFYCYNNIYIDLFYFILVSMASLNGRAYTLNERETFSYSRNQTLK